MSDYKKFNEVPLSAFQARYGKSIPDNDYPTNEFIENLLKRKTVRRYRPKKLDPKLLEKLIAAAQSAPTSSMIQTWSVLILETPESKFKLFEGDFKGHMGILPSPNLNSKPSDAHNFNAIMECSVFLIWMVDCTIPEQIFTDPSLDITHPELSVLRHSAKESMRHATFEIRSISDAIIAAQTFVLSAESMGLGTMYCGSIKTMDLQKTFNIPDRAMPLFGICVGYPKENLNAFGQVNLDGVPNYTKPRLPQDVIVHREMYKPLDFEKVKEYNNLLKLYYEIQNLGYDWFDRVVRRTQLYQKINLKYRELVEKYGFKLK